MGKSHFLNLSLFDGSGSGSGAGASTGNAATSAAPATAPVENSAKDGQAAPAVEVVYGKAPAAEAKGQDGAAAKQAPEVKVDYDAEFEKLIKGDYKDAYDKRMKGALQDRFKKADATERQFLEAQKFLDAAALRYGKDPSDVAGLMEAFDSDKAWLAQESLTSGKSEDEILEHRQLLRDRAELQRMRQQQQVQGDLNRWLAEGAALQGTYPGLDVLAELNNPQSGSEFLGLLRSGVGVDKAYKAVHMDEILGGAMQLSAQKATEKVTNDIKARGMRPSENGASGAAPARVYKSDPSKWDDKDIDRVRKQVLAGETIRL